MKRAVLALLLVVAAVGFTVVSLGAGDDDSGGQKYWVELDNAFGLIEGADVKVAGVRAGKITEMKLQESDMRALIGIQVGKGGFGSLRTDVFCESRPQSLIGEYFLDCIPGRASTRLKPGATIPVEQTGSTVPVDLVNNIMRRPFRERFTILLSELGAGLAARGEDLNETIRRANPALRETDKTLAILAEQRNVIRDLYKDADTVLKALADNRTEITRFVAEARDTARISASRSEGIRAQFQRLPTFLRELTLTMPRLGEAAEAQTPLLRTLNSQAGNLTTFFDTLGPFSDASRPALNSLADAADAGRPFVRAGRPQIAELRRFAGKAPEVATNLALILEDLDNRDRAVERDPRSPNGKGYTGLEAILKYVFNQSQAINLFDGNQYLLKVSAFLDSVCANYTNAEQAKDPARNRCAAILGPNRPGINQPDPTSGTPAGVRAAQPRSGPSSAGGAEAAGGAPAAGGDAQAGGTGAAAPRPALPDLPANLDAVVQGLLGPSGQSVTDALGTGGQQGRGGDDPTNDLLGYLLGP